MTSIAQRARQLFDIVVSRRFMPPDVDDAVDPAQLRLEEVAIVDGVRLLPHSGAPTDVTPVGEGPYAEVRTPKQTWAYAAYLKLAQLDLPAEGELLLRVDLWVRRGAVGVGVTGPGGSFLCEERRSLADGRTAVDLRVRGDAGPDQLIVRNGGHGASVAVVERIQVYRVLEDPFRQIEALKAPTPVSAASRPIGDALPLAAPALAKAGSNPLVSLVLTVKDGMPYLRDALESVRAQSYRNIELVVQDCLSQDGTSELIAGFDGAPVKAIRERDGGIGDANNRAQARCSGAIVGSVDSDNLLEPETVARAVEHFAGRPNDAVVFGSVRMISAEGADQGIYRPGPFDFLRFVSCDLGLPWSTAFFNRQVCGQALTLDPALKTCADYDTWLRLSYLPISFMDAVQGSTRISSNSMTCQPENYEQFCRDKAFALKRYADACAHEPLRGALMRHGMVGIYCWAAESINGLAPDESELIADYYERAKAVDPVSARVALAATRLFR